MARTLYLFLFVLLHLYYVHSLVLQPPVHLTKPLAGANETDDHESPFLQNPCGSPTPNSSSVLITTLSRISEPPPEGFTVEFQSISGGRDLGKFDIWLSFVANMARTAINRWNLEVSGRARYPIHSNVELFIISSVNAPRYQTKSMVWTLQKAFYLYNERGLYASAQFITRLRDSTGVHNLGIMRMKSMLSVSSSGQGNLSNNASTEDVVWNVSSLTPDLEQASQALGTASLNLDTASSPSSNSVLDMTDPGASAAGFTISLTYTPHGARFGERGFFSTIISMLVSAASHDPKSAASGPVSAYNSDEDYTISVRPTSAAARRNLPWHRLIQVLGFLPSEMYGEQRGGKWAELEGRARFDGAFIGKISIQKGDHTNGGSMPCITLH